MVERSTRVCDHCGRAMEWRRRWSKSRSEVHFCSQACRREGRRPASRARALALEAAILELLLLSKRGATICPSEAARRAAAADPTLCSRPEAWQELLEPAQAAARRLVADGRVEILQRGRTVDPSTARGPIRIRRSG